MGWFSKVKGQRMETEHKIPEPERKEEQRELKKAPAVIEKLGKQLRAWFEKK